MLIGKSAKILICNHLFLCKRNSYSLLNHAGKNETSYSRNTDISRIKNNCLATETIFTIEITCARNSGNTYKLDFTELSQNFVTIGSTTFQRIKSDSQTISESFLIKCRSTENLRKPYEAF